MTYLAHWGHLDPDMRFDAEGDAVVVSDERDDTAASHGRLYVQAVDQISGEQHRPVVVTRLTAVA